MIRGQFLTEAVTLSLLGGLAGIAIGVAVPSASACPRAGPSPSAMALGFLVASTVGVFFGAYLASRAGGLKGAPGCARVAGYRREWRSPAPTSALHRF